MELKGTSSDQLADVLATGESDARTVFVSFSAREPAGRDAEYIEWHTLDHRPEQYRLAGLRNALRLVSTPECRALRAASAEPFDAVDHVMTYQFTDTGPLGAFSALGAALDAGGRMSLRLPSVRFFVGELAGRLASPKALIGADVVPWRPHAGVYLLLERGHATPEDLLQVPGVTGIWWYHGTPSHPRFAVDSTGLQISYCYLDEVAAATGAINDIVRRRWATPGVTGLLAAPFYATVPFAWDRHLP